MTSQCRRLSVVLACSLVALAANSVRADYVSTVLSDGPIGYWRLGESVDTDPTADAALPAQDLDYLPGTGDGSFTFGQTGAIVGDTNTAVAFTPSSGSDATGGAASTHPSVASTNSTDFGFASGQSFSIEYWVRVAPGNASSVSGPGLVTKGYDSSQETPWYLSRYTGGKVDFFVRSPDKFVTSLTNVTDDRWHHVVGVYDAGGAELRLYVDGYQEASVGGVAANAYGTNGRPLSIANHANRGFAGQMDEVAIYESALTSGQVFTHYATGSDVVFDPVLNVDFGRNPTSGSGPGGEQLRFTAFETAEGGGDPDVTRSFPSSLGAGNLVDVTIGGYTHLRDYAAVTGDFAAASPLLSDMVLRNSHDPMTLTLDNLLPGTYQMTTYHHSTGFGGGTFDVNLTDANGTVPGLFTVVPVSDGPTPANISTLTIPIVSDGSAVQVQFVGGASDPHLSLNGFQLERAIPTEPVLAIDFNARNAAGPSTTEAGFDEFLLGDPGNEEMTTPTTRAYGGISVTVSPLDGRKVGDRRRSAPNNGGLFTEQELLKDVLFFRGTGPEDGGCDVLVEGLGTGTEYLVTIWSLDDGSPVNRTSDWFANGQAVKSDYQFDGAAVPPAPGLDGTYSFDFVATADENGELLVSGRNDGPSTDGAPQVFLNAMTIARVVPEPSGVLLLVFGMATLVSTALGRRRGER